MKLNIDWGSGKIGVPETLGNYKNAITSTENKARLFWVCKSLDRAVFSSKFMKFHVFSSSFDL